MAKLKIAGAWSGVLEVELEEWTVPMLREEVAKRSNCGSESINLICAGKVLKDGDGTQKLAQLGFKNNSKVLASRVSADQGKALKDELMAEEERSTRLSRLKAAVNSLAKRHADGSLPIEDYNIELENQSGETVQLGSETDQRAVMMGLMLHANAKQLIRTERYKDALEVLAMGEEAFSLCDSKVIELIDNVPILQIDMVWCYFMLRDISWLSVAGMRLSKAKEGIERAHGKESSRLRLLQGARHPEIALHLRMELLEGVVAYHSGQFEKSRQALTSAQTKYFQLQVPDEALSLLMSMGYKEHHAKRALRMSNQDVQSAVDFLVEEKAKKAQKQEEDIRRRNDIMEQKCYGMTPLKKPVDLQRLNELVSIGFAKDLAAEALRRNENDTQKALDDLTNPESNSAIQLDIESKKRKRLRRAADAAIEELISMGFPRATVVEAVRAFGTKDRALSHLLGQSDSNPAIAVDGDANSSASTLGADILSTEGGVEGSSSVNGDIEGPSHKIDDRDVEMEVELTEDLHNADAFSDYDIEVAKEGEAISEYLALLASSENGEKVSSSSH
ncbi:LOW QUALITY PROTEIN: NEDD8 ultimate buster 1 [Camellia sinensis]|uniref:LOW QUALITY PROTEIN: NEDD8 ultimate buster 1 n=1 Tax=Camellia sinensis TaxID=4442 RepID=UPI0010360D41|nr:LOW QUALITY PROTEIN: NEDD8 ultimate buster 1 [Camellia sinensis]